MYLIFFLKMLVKTYVQRLRFIWVFNTTFNNINYLMVVGFIDGRIKRTLREQSSCDKSLTNLNI
jgi:hypothetical protein